MVQISGTKIRMTRGDTLRLFVNLEVEVKDENGNIIDTHQYVPEEGDKIRFAMKYDYDDENPILVKDIPIDSLLLTLDPEDTKDLDTRARLVYDIEITCANGDVYTFINKAKLILTEEVY